ncbi:c-type cytochrome, partial [Singulisphaera acidiphila]
DAADPWVRTAILSAAIANPAGLFERLWSDRPFAASAEGLSLLRPLALVVGARAQPDEIGRLLDTLATGAPDEAGIEVALGFGDGIARTKRRLSELRTNASPTAIAWLDRLFQDAATRAPDTTIPAEQRVKAITLLGRGDFEAARTILPPLLDPHQPLDVQGAALRALAGFDRPEVADLLLAPWKGYTPPLRSEVVGFLLGRRIWIPPLLNAVKRGIVPVGQIPPTRRALLLQDSDPAILEQAQALLGAEAPGPRTEAIAKYKGALDRPGDPGRGKTVFERECFACHKLGERGHAVGPNLAGVRKRTPDEILVNILDPNREVSPEFLEYSVALDDGRVVTGLVASETPSGVTLRAREGVEQTILRRNVEEIASTGKSLMPEGLEKTVNPAEMADLIAFLLRIQD